MRIIALILLSFIIENAISQVTIYSISHPISDSCTGEFEVLVTENTSSLPLTFILMQNSDTISTSEVFKHGISTFKEGMCHPYDLMHWNENEN